MAKLSSPPGWALLFLWPFKGERDYDQIRGDINEEFEELQRNRGEAAARRWFIWEVFRSSIILCWRKGNILAVVVPLLGISVSNLFVHPALRSFSRMLSPAGNWTIPWTLAIYQFVESSIIGLLLGSICSLILVRQARLMRLVFSAYYLLILVITQHEIGTKVPASQAVVVVGLFAAYLRPIWTLTCIWIGSIWTEVRTHRIVGVC